MGRRLRIAPLRTWVHLVRELQNHPCNRDGADKTWVVELMEEMDDMFSHARPISPRRRRPPLR